MSIDIWQSELRPASHVLGRRLEDTFFLVNLETNSVFELNATGTELWLWLEEHHSLIGCLDFLQSKFDVELEELRAQVGSLVEDLLHEGLLEMTTREPAPVVELIPVARTIPQLPRGSWVLRWEPGTDKPTVEIGDRLAEEKVDVVEMANGNIVVFDGYLFDVPNDDRTSQSPARHIGALYEARGDDFIRDLRGGFCVAIWDRNRARLIVARDGMGLHPAYYFWNDRVFLVSSTIEALLAQSEVQNKPHVIRIAEYLLSASFSHHLHETFYRDIRRLPPAHLLTLRSSFLALSRYWDPLPLGFQWASADELAEFESVLRKAVSRCVSVGAQGIALSGGFDSVGIAAMAAEMRGQNAPLTALSVRFKNAEINEEATQARVARALGMPQVFRDVDPATTGEDLVASALANSVVNSSPVIGLWQGLYSTLFQTAQELGLQRILFGTGGDEMLVVDARYAHDLFLQRDVQGFIEFMRAWQRTSPFSSFRVGKFLLWDAAIKPTLRNQIRSFAGPSGARLYHEVRNRFHALAIPMRRNIVDEIQDRARKAAKIPLAPGEGNYIEAMRDLPQMPLLSTENEQGREWAGRYGVRILYPFYDREFVDLALRVHPRHLYQGGRMKGPLRELVMKKLPSVMMPVRKVDFTMLGRDVLRRFGRNSWSRLQGATRLAELGIVDPVATESVTENFFSGRSERWVPVWQLLSTEAWLAARFARS